LKNTNKKALLLKTFIKISLAVRLSFTYYRTKDPSLCVSRSLTICPYHDIYYFIVKF